MKYYAYLKDKNYNLINKFWFNSQYSINEVEKVLESAKNIADQNNYKYKNISIGVKS